MERDSFIGVWDMLADAVHSEVILNPDSTYRHVFWFGAQSHWGAWSLQEQDEHTTLVMELHGAQPMVTFGPMGFTPVPWPAAEQWVVTGVQDNQVNFYGGLMVRRFIGAAQSAPQAAPAPPYAAAPPPPVDYAALRAYSAPQPPPPPAPHNAAVLQQWQAVNVQNFAAQAKLTTDLYTASANANRAMLDAQLQATAQTSAMFHQNAQRFSKMMNP